MRRIRYAVAASLDGFIADLHGEADWIPRDPDMDFAALMAQFDTLLVGRRTFETMVRAGRPTMPGMKTVVCSTTLKSEDYPSVSVVRRDVEAVITELRSEGGKDVWLFGGGELFSSLVSLGAVDTVEITVAPVLLGGGVPLLPVAGHRVQLELTKHQIYPKSGLVRLEYTVRRAA